ncbi:hypothetical protein DSECCO2_523710 [anaerobic digester metagenome]
MEELQQTVDIVPLGHEYDRAIAPFRIRKVDRVHLLTIQAHDGHDPAMFEKQRHFNRKVEAFLRGHDIDVRVVSVDLFDIRAVMNAVAQLVKTEQEVGNSVFVNMSACGRLTSVGATLAGMAHNATVYYVHADGYSVTQDQELEHGLSICTTDRVERLYNFPFALPSDDEQQLLVELCRRERVLAGRGADEVRLNSREMRKLHDHPKMPAVRAYFIRNQERGGRTGEQYFLTWLNKVFLEKLLLNGYIVKTRETRREWRLGITDAGRYLAAISGEDLAAPAHTAGSRAVFHRERP